MSTHFRPRPSPAPPSPVRPSTAHSTIRTVPPSPPDSRDEYRKPPAFQPRFSSQRPSSPPRSRDEEHDFGDEQAATHATDQPEVKDFAQRDETGRPASPIIRGVNSGRHSPVKARSSSPEENPVAAPVHAPTSIPQPAAATMTRPTQRTPASQQESDDDVSLTEAPYTPSRVSSHQRKRAYLPLGHTPRPVTPQDPDTPYHPSSQRISPTRQPIQQKPPYSQTASPPRSALQRSTSNRISNSGSAVSRHSVFSTPGRDEMERKKALVEADEGPFARVTSMSDLDEVRRRVSSGRRPEAQMEKGPRKKRTGVGVGTVCKGCVVM